MVTKAELQRKGGKWLGAARSWIQWHCNNGSTVTWGSSEGLRPTLSVRDVEDLAAEVAVAAINEYVEKTKTREAIKWGI